jgi:hydroxymethylbilane synthase
MKIRIGTRKSALALAQTQMVNDAICSHFPQAEIEIVHISTKGDKILDKPLSQIGGKGIFVSEIEKALQRGDIDVAVHSGKDLPASLGENLEIPGVLSRGNYRDVLVTLTGANPHLPGFKIGTGSMRRRICSGRLYPLAEFCEIRGNVDTRLCKLKKGEYDGLILAGAGLERLGLYGLSGFSFKAFDCPQFLPAACQGIIAMECRKGSQASLAIKQISHRETLFCFETERRVLELLGADCTMPVSAFAQTECGSISLTVSKDCKKILSGKEKISRRLELAEELISQL